MQEVGRVNCTLSEEFVVKVSVHQGSVLNHLLFIMVLEVWLCEFRSRFSSIIIHWEVDHKRLGMKCEKIDIE